MQSLAEIKGQLGKLPLTKRLKEMEAYRQDGRIGVQKLLRQYGQEAERLEKEKERLKIMHQFEEEYRDFPYICGIDEVGRGPFAGPVVACAVILPKDDDILYLNDSKKLSEKMRETLCAEIKEKAVGIGIGMADNKRIDEINILNATYEAMRQAIGELPFKPSVLLNDAVTIPDVLIRQVPIIKGDQKSVSISAASIVAKVTRDHMMEEYEKEWPGYFFAKNKGYGTAEHIEALKKLGACPLHRRSFIHRFI